MIFRNLLSLLFLPSVLCLGSRIALFTGTVPLEIDGKDCPYGIILDASFSFSCVCLTGLWAFYDNACSSPNKIIGAVQETCIFVNQTVEKVHLLSSPSTLSQTALIFTDDMKKLKGRLELDSGTQSVPLDPSGRTKFVLSSGSNTWGLGLDNKCFGDQQKKKNYCVYDHNVQTKINLETSCATFADAEMIPSEKCTPYVTTSSAQCSNLLGKAFAPTKKPPPKPSQAGRWFEKMPSTAAKVKAPEEAEEPPTPPKSSKQQAIKRGRVFLRPQNTTTEPVGDAGGGTGNGTNNGTGGTLPDYHEDRNLTSNITFPQMNSQIWNYMTSRAMEILNLTTPKIQEPLSPNFRFLELSKQIIQKACPDHYVKDGHFDLALQTVINLQKKVYGFNDEFSDFAAELRIEDSLQVCLENITEYPFVDPLQRTAEKCNETVELGTFERFGEQMNLNVSWASSGREREPLIETVWKIFTHAHAACYGFFEEAGYNDHHRFAAATAKVFSNGINDIWKAMGVLTEDTYSGLLGNPIRLMDGVTYCAEFAKLDTAYPWEIPRPEKEVNRRRKRSIANNAGMCLKEAYDNSCSKGKGK